jgi:hypothetical protein
VLALFSALVVDVSDEFEYVRNSPGFSKVAPRMTRTPRRRRHVVDWMRPPTPGLAGRLQLAARCCTTLTEMTQGPCVPNQLVVVRNGGLAHVAKLIDFAGAMQLNAPVAMQSASQERGSASRGGGGGSGGSGGGSSGEDSEDDDASDAGAASAIIMSWCGGSPLGTVRLRKQLQQKANMSAWAKDPDRARIDRYLGAAEGGNGSSSAAEEQAAGALLASTQLLEVGVLQLLTALLEGGPASCGGELTRAVLGAVDVELAADNLEMHWRAECSRGGTYVGAQMRESSQSSSGEGGSGGDAVDGSGGHGGLNRRQRIRATFQGLALGRRRGELSTTPFLYYSLLCALRDTAAQAVAAGMGGGGGGSGMGGHGIGGMGMGGSRRGGELDDDGNELSAGDAATVFIRRLARLQRERAVDAPGRAMWTKLDLMVARVEVVGADARLGAVYVPSLAHDFLVFLLARVRTHSSSTCFPLAPRLAANAPGTSPCPPPCCATGARRRWRRGGRRCCSR